MEFRADFREFGPILSGRASHLIGELEREIELETAREAERLIHLHLGNVLRRPTGYYQSQIGIRGAPGGLEVTDSGVVYGPWLEGTGSKNFPVTRFKGYS